MKLTAFAPSLLVLASGLASTSAGHGWGDLDCLTDDDAAFLVDILVSISVKFDPEYVTQFLTDDFVLQSDSINWIFGIPLGKDSFTDKNVLLAGSYNLTQTEPQPPIVVSYIMHTCADIAYRSTTIETTPVQGIHILKTRREDGIWKATVSWDEFNSAADLFALGVTGCVLPKS
ncbi:uncharacterized protein HMPREF1541_04726 [Cyphellophora europaea CBS 101466]|uniref:NTF2-like domain-containing protein n=1 Tax=Cyphellophora europaea (strain CBS 101466) TaxID=1220924 RepID=W2RXQ6_CYPE1|nr:uncharacterized protein HMPREF1541_04726 [Cyphellophora europaea CBS 101466]ETN40449.1 hypothetical protein HMPREF1541_04726 [Cyphellophora europaea CBS 101466]